MTTLEDQFASTLHLVEYFNSRLTDWHTEAADYDLTSLGEVEFPPLGPVAFPIWLVRPVTLVPDVPTLLVAGAFHGDEPCGAWGILKFLCENLRGFQGKANLSFLPLVNPTGFKANHRENYFGQNPNSGFVPEFTDKPSVEGEILIKNESELLTLAKDGFLSLHEDRDQTQVYMYSFEKSDKLGPFSQTLINTLGNHFPIVPDGPVEDGIADRGIIFNHPDGSFEDRLFRHGVTATACTETPGKMPPAQRIACNCHVVSAFVEYHLRNE